MRTYGQYCPLARAAEVLGTRWTLIIVRNLLMGCRTFGEIEAGAPGIPKALLRDRLARLETLGLVQRRPKPAGRGSEWELTPAGQGLGPVCDALAQWGNEWLEIGPEHVDPYATLWSLCRMLPDRGPGRLVVRFEFRGHDPPRIWLLVEDGAAELCMKPPGFEEAAVVHTDPMSLVHWYVGRLSLGDALHAGRMRVEGGGEALRTLRAWGGLGGVPVAA